MSILDTIKKVMPYLKTDSGYVLCRLSSQAVEMDDGLTLEQKVTSLNSLIESKVDTSSVVNNALTTEEGFVLDARQGKELDDKITELNGKLSWAVYDQDTLSIEDFYDVSAFDMRKKGGEVFLNVSISLQSSAQFDPNTLYTINTKPLPVDLRPSKTYHLQGVGCNSNWGQATAMTVIIEPSGYIKYTATSRSAFFKLSGHWFTD